MEPSFLDAVSRRAGGREESLPRRTLELEPGLGGGLGKERGRKDGCTLAGGGQGGGGGPASRTLSLLGSEVRRLASGAVMAVCRAFTHL